MYRLATKHVHYKLSAKKTKADFSLKL